MTDDKKDGNIYVKLRKEVFVMTNKIRGYRNMVGKTQKQFATLLGITETSYRLKEVGIREFKQNEMKQIHSELQRLGINVSISDIFFD